MGSQMSEFNKSGTMVGRPGRGLLIAILLAALPVIATAAVILIRDRGDDAASVAPAAAALETETQQFLIERGWMSAGTDVGDAAELSRFTTAPGRGQARALEEDGLPADRSAAAAAASERPAYFTEPYWEMAAEAALEKEAGLEVPAVPIWGPDQEYGLLLREKASLRSNSAMAGLNESGASSAAAADAYYTERYWKLSSDALRSEPAVEPEWDYYTQRYWEAQSR